ncbi:unnamed protein product, partial [Medioppia subpectinata]
MLVEVNVNNFAVRAIVCLALLMGCIWHIVDISVIYFRYETTVSIVLDRAQLIELPAITICTNVSHVIDTEYLRHRYPNDTALVNITDTNENKWQYRQYLLNLTLEEQLLNGTIGANRFFNICGVRAPLALSNVSDRQYHHVNCTLVSPVVESINNYYKCFTIFNQNGSKLTNRYRVDHDAEFHENGFNLFWFALNTTYLRELSLYMHDRREPFVGRVEGQSTTMIVDHRHYGTVGISYKEIDINRLPPPYRTQCADYRSLGYRSKKDWISQCRVQYYRDQFSSWPPWTLYRKEHVGNLSFAPMSLPLNRTIDKQIAADCANRIGRRPDCHAVYYTMNTFYSYPRVVANDSNDSNTLFWLFCIVPTDPITRYVHSPRMELSEYMGIIGGVSGLWFGLNILAFYDIGNYETTVSTVLDRPQVIELPAITLCSHINNAIDVDYLRHRYPNDTALANITDTNENKWQYKPYLFNLTLEEQLLNGTIGANRFFNYCGVRAPLEWPAADYTNCSSVSPIVESINNYQKCFTMFNQNASQLANNNRYRVDHDATFRENGFNLFWLALNTQYLRELSVYMHDRRQPFVGRVEGQSTPMNFDHKHYGIIAIAYKEVDINRLPPPYRTQCADYTSL